MAKGRYEQLYLSKALGSMCWRGVREQSRMSDAWSGRLKDGTSWSGNNKGNSLIPQKSRVGRPASQLQGEQFTAIARNTAGLEDHAEMVTGESRSTALLREKVSGRSQISESVWKTITKVKEMKIKGGEED